MSSQIKAQKTKALTRGQLVKKLHNQAYYRENKDTILKWHKVKVNCPNCNRCVTRGAMSKHRRSKRCKAATPKIIFIATEVN